MVSQKKKKRSVLLIILKDLHLKFQLMFSRGNLLENGRQDVLKALPEFEQAEQTERTQDSNIYSPHLN